MKKINIAIIVGTRPEIIRLSRIIDRIENDENFELTLIHTGQNYDYELNEIFFEDLNLKRPDIYLNCNGSPSETIGNILIKTDQIFKTKKIDALLILGDTNSCLSAYSAKRNNIPVFHMEAGNRCFDKRVPEELNRKVVDHISDINLTYSSIARNYLLQEGIKADRIIKTGSPMAEVINHYSKTIDNSNILAELNLSKNKYILISFHRDENTNTDYKIEKFIKILKNLKTKYKLPIIISTHPRLRNALEKFRFNEKDIFFLKPFSFSDYVNLQINSFITISDSGTITEESSILGFSAINFRDSHERPEGMEESSVILSGFNSDNLLIAIDVEKNKKQRTNYVFDYNDLNVSEKIIRILVSYIHYVKN